MSGRCTPNLNSTPRFYLPLAWVVLLAACSGPAADPSDNVVVFAAASLTESFEAVADAFEAAHPGLEVVFSFAGSQQLASQIEQGAPADVFAAADTKQMDRIAGADLTSAEPTVFAHNLLTVVVEPGNPLGIKGLEDLGRDGLVLVLPAPDVPAGAYAREVLDRAGVAVAPASLEADVRAARAKVELGEADASIVYATDAAASGNVDEVPIPESQNVVADYPVAPLRDAPNPDAAAEFVAFVLSDEGASILESFGFAGVRAH